METTHDRETETGFKALHFLDYVLLCFIIAVKMTFYKINFRVNIMDDSFDNNNDQDAVDKKLDSMITEFEANANYNDAGKLVPEDRDSICLGSHYHLLDSKSTVILNDVKDSLSLSYHLSDFQILSLNTLYQKRDLILVSPTGSGKEGYFN